MNAFPLLAAMTLCISFAVLYASFEDLREGPLTLDPGTAPMREIAARRLLTRGTGPGGRTPGHAGPGSLLRKAVLPALPHNMLDSDEGLLDHEIASEDPLQSWLDRYLTPPAKSRIANSANSQSPKSRVEP